MNPKRKKKKPFNSLLKGREHRNVMEDIHLCSFERVPETRIEPDHVTMTIEGKEIILTYGQFAYIHISTSIVYGKGWL